MFISVIDRQFRRLRRSSDGIVPYSSSYLEGAQSEIDVQTGHTVTHSPKTEEEVVRILKLNLGGSSTSLSGEETN
jgi:hypothetical protein